MCWKTLCPLDYTVFNHFNWDAKQAVFNIISKWYIANITATNKTNKNPVPLLVRCQMAWYREQVPFPQPWMLWSWMLLLQSAVHNFAHREARLWVSMAVQQQETSSSSSSWATDRDYCKAISCLDGRGQHAAPICYCVPSMVKIPGSA